MSTGRHNVPIYCRYDKSGTRPDIGATMCRLYRRCGPAIRRHNNRGTAVTRRMLIQWRLRSVSLLSTTTAVLICDRRDCGRAAGELQVYYSRLGGAPSPVRAAGRRRGEVPTIRRTLRVPARRSTRSARRREVDAVGPPG